ncbi:cordon-bleu protein-like 1 isoform X1 [Alosa sapidissima]|uniref:cordon-bleu protein-like 1 isoform X1 n=1 Tax=Alosa sapidissima TaxID=34773 RepID=UPI001C09BC3B|nr:cordon-bleu protein-like 1 isoform X1 [Alosa sapidissima]XP_041937351.1 cordon-bleu protein-like 1 isoform X1 [Alosa sapidissima]
MEVCEDMVDRELTLTVLLPGGTEETATVHGSKPVMDLLVTLCGEYHLNPSEHIMELVSPNQNHIKFKPNSLIGSLDAEKVVLRHRGEDERTKRKGPYVPEVSVRLMIFYRQVHRAVVRVSPKVPLSELLPAICDKCEYDPDTTLLFLNSQSEEPLDLTKSLNDHGIREVFAKDMKVINLPEPIATTPDSEASKENKLPPAKEKSEKGKDNKSFFSFFRIAKKKTQKNVSASVPTSPLLQKQRTLSLSFLTSRCSTLPSEKSKKRRAPLPPMLASQSFPTNLNTSQPVLTAEDSGKETTLSHSSSSESSLKRTKRRAPPPPALPPPSSPPTPDDDAPEDLVCKDVLGNLAPVREVPEETLNEDQSINYPVAALIHHTTNGTGDCLCEELHSNDKPCEECSVCVECGSRKSECDGPTPGGQPEGPAESPASPSRRTPSIGSSRRNSPSWMGVGSSSGRLLRSSGSGLTTFTIIPKLRDRERQHRTYQVEVVLEKQQSLEGLGPHSEQVEPNSRSTGNGEHEGNASESADKSKDWRAPDTKPKSSSGVPFWVSQRSTVGHTSLMQELQKRVPVLNGEPHYQNTDRAEGERKYDEREDQGGRNVEKKEEEEKEENVDEEEEWEEGKASHEERMEQERDEVEEEEEEDKEEEEEGEGEDKEEEEEEEEGEGEDDEGFDGSEKESIENDDDEDEDDGGEQEEEDEEEEKREEIEKEDFFPPPPPPVFWKESAKASQYSPTEAEHHPVDLSSTPGSCGSGKLPVSESPGGLSLFALAVAQRAQRFTQAFNTRASSTNR